METLVDLTNTIIHCRKCPRLVAWREKVSKEKRRAYQGQEYWGKPVPGFGDPHGRVFVIGLAPGAHGSNRTGRQFTGDSSGDFLYPALFRAGFASRPNSVSRDDGMFLTDLYTAPVCRCVPPDNRPSQQELINCQEYLETEINVIKPIIFVALGKIAFTSILKIINKGSEDLPRFDHGKSFVFSHNASYLLGGGRWLISSYHPSRQNTQTGRLTESMFHEIWINVHRLLSDSLQLAT